MDADLEKRARELLAQHEQHDKTGGAPVVRRDDAIRALAAALSAGQADVSRQAAQDARLPAPRNRREAAALARTALAYLGVIEAHIDAAVARCETGAAIAASGERDE